MLSRERKQFQILGIAKDIVSIVGKEELLYKFHTENTTLLFKTKKEYESEYDRLLAKTDRISCNVESINEKGDKTVISAIRYLKPSC